MDLTKKRGAAERRFDIQCRMSEESGGEMYVEGYALVFDSPTVLFEQDGVEYREQICRGALDGAQMADVIFNYNHGGRVMARTRNDTLMLAIDEKGLFVRARLDGTEEGRRMFDEIRGGYIDKMSFRFTISEESYDRENRQWNVRKIKRLYDVSAVDIPAYDDTSIAARRAEAEECERNLEIQRGAAAAAALRERVLIKTKY